MKKIKIRGHFWKIKDESDLEVGLLGLCDYDNKTLNIPYEGDTKEELGTIIHESLHAIYPDLNEEAIQDGEDALTNILWKLKWRKSFD